LSPSAISLLSLHDALPIFHRGGIHRVAEPLRRGSRSAEGGVRTIERIGEHRYDGGALVLDLAVIESPVDPGDAGALERFDYRKVDRKSTRLNSSHLGISYA